MIYKVQCFMEVYKGQICVLSEVFPNYAENMEGESVIKATTFRSKNILFVTEIVCFFKVYLDILVEMVAVYSLLVTESRLIPR